MQHKKIELEPIYIFLYFTQHMYEQKDKKQSDKSYLSVHQSQKREVKNANQGEKYKSSQFKQNSDLSKKREEQYINQKVSQKIKKKQEKQQTKTKKKLIVKKEQKIDENDQIKNQKKQQQQKSEYVQCYNENDPESLVLLRNKQAIKRILIDQNKDQAIICCFINQKDQKMAIFFKNLKSRIYSQLKLQLYLQDNFLAIKQDCQNCEQRKVVLVISSNDMRAYSNQIKQQKKLICLVYSQEKEDLNLENIIYFRQFEEIKNKLKSFKREKQFVNFYFVHPSQIAASNRLIRAINCMLKQNIKGRAKQQILEQFCQLISQLSQNSQLYKEQKSIIEKFKCLMSIQFNVQANYKQYLSSYTQETVFYKIINNLLRSARQPAEIFYLQPYFHHLFSSVNFLFQKQKSEEFVCYRGAQIEENELSKYKVGQIILNLSFLSTSKDPQIARKYGNSLLKITVGKKKGKTILSNGYAQIQQFSKFQREKQVLFNPMNSFKIVSIGKDVTGKDLIELAYDPLDQFLDQRSSQQQYKNLAELHQLIKNEVENQGELFIEGKAFLKGAEQYWDKYLSLSENKKGGQRESKIKGLFYKGKIEENKNNNKAAIEIYKQVLLLDQQNQKGLNSLAVAYKKNDQNKNSKLTFERQLKVIEKKHGNQSFEYASCLSNIANVQETLGNYQTAIQMHEKSSNILKKRNFNVEYANSINNLANAIFKTGDYKKAFELQQKCLKIRQSGEGEEHIDTAISFNNLGITMEALGFYKQAQEKYIKAMQIKQKLLTKEHSDYAGTINNLSGLYQKFGRYKQSQTLLKECMQIRRKKLGDLHVQYIDSLSIQAKLNENFGNYQYSIQLHEKSVEFRKAKLGNDHFDTASSLNNLGVVHLRVGIYKKAFDQLKQSMNVRRQRLGQKNIDYASSLNNYGALCQKVNLLKQSNNCYQECLKIKEEIVGNKHQIYGVSINNMGLLRLLQGRYKQSFAFFDKAKQIMKNNFSDSHISQVYILNNIGVVKQMEGKFRQGISAFSQGLKIIKEIFKENDMDIDITFLQHNLNLAEACQKQDFKMAELQLKKFEKSIVKNFGQNSLNQFIILNNLMTLNGKLSNLDQSHKICERIEQMCQKIENNFMRFRNSINYGIFLINKSNMSDPQERIEILQKAYDILKVSLNKDHILLTILSHNKGIAYYLLGQKKGLEILSQTKNKLEIFAREQKHQSFKYFLANYERLAKITDMQGYKLDLSTVGQPNQNKTL